MIGYDWSDYYSESDLAKDFADCGVDLRKPGWYFAEHDTILIMERGTVKGTKFEHKNPDEKLFEVFVWNGTHDPRVEFSKILNTPVVLNQRE